MRHDVCQLNLEKTLECFKIQESLRSEKYYLCKGIFLYIFLCTLKSIIHKKSKTNHRIS